MKILEDTRSQAMLSPCRVREKPEFRSFDWQGKNLNVAPDLWLGVASSKDVFPKGVWLYIPEFKVTLG